MLTGIQKVHWTRVIHVSDNRENNEAFGIPRLQRLYNRNYDLRKILGGSGEMFWRGGFPGIGFKVDPAIKNPGPIDVKGIKAEMADYAAGLQRYFAMEGMTAESMTPTVADPTNHFDVNLKAIAISLGIPYRVFTGSEEAKLAGDADKNAWISRINKRRDMQCTPYVIRPLLDALVLAGAVEFPNDGEYSVEWPDLNVQTAQEKSTVAKDITEALSKYVSASGIDQVMPPLEFMTDVLGIPEKRAKAILESADEFAGALTDDLLNKKAAQQKDIASAKNKPDKGFGKPKPGKPKAKGKKPVKRK
jgi:hypothetical protein